MTHDRPSPTRLYPPDWLTDDEAAYMLSLPVSTFREFVAGGLLPEGVKLGKHRRWSRTALNASLERIGAPTDDGSLSQALRGVANGEKSKGRRHAA